MSRNVVLVTYDSLRADHCSFMGYDRETTPTLDSMAADGLVFEHAVASGVPTVASMTAVMTGEHSLASPEVGLSGEQREQVTSRPTVAEVLNEAGYATGGLSPNPPASSYFGFDAGFDWFEDFLAEDRGLLERAWSRVFQRSITGESRAATALRLLRNVVRREEVLRPWEAYYDELLAWRASVEEPYFLWVLLLDTHHPWLPPADARDWSSRWDAWRAFELYFRMLSSGWEPEFSEAERRRLVDLYDDSIRYGDRFLARLLADLADDDPVFVVHSDHGEEFGAHGRYGHQPYLYEDLVHVPLVISGTDRSGTVTRPVELRDLAPTICELAGVDGPFHRPSLLADADGTIAYPKVFVDGGRRVAARTALGKLIRDGDGREELYDLGADPGERANLAGEAPELRRAFNEAISYHVGTEREGRAIRRASEALAGRGGI